MKKLIINEAKMLNMVNNIIESKTGNRLKIKTNKSKNKRIIKLTESEFKSLIKETVNKHIRENNYYELVEMSINEDGNNFDLEEFSQIKSFKGRIKYCEDRLPRISSGSSRIVYQYDNNKVIKMAKNKKGLAQNEVEINISGEQGTPELYDYNEDGLWLLVQYARKVGIKEFKELNYGLNPRETVDIVNSIVNGRTKISNELKERAQVAYNDDESMLNDLANIVGSYDMLVNEYSRLSSYGVVEDNDGKRLVIVDYGASNDVYNNYYNV